MNKKLTPEERDVVVAQLSLLLDGLTPSELHDVLLAAGVYAPAVSSMSYVRNILAEKGLAADHDEILAAVRDRTIRIVGAMLRENWDTELRRHTGGISSDQALKVLRQLAAERAVEMKAILNRTKSDKKGDKEG